MSDYTPPPPGRRVRITFEGIVSSSDKDWISLETDQADGPNHVEWTHEDFPPTVVVLAPDFRMGDVGSYTDSRGLPRTVFYMALPGKASGWYDAQGRQVHFNTNQHPDMVVRYDGSIVKEVVR